VIGGLEAGADAAWLHYNADFRRTGYEVFGLSGQLIWETLFPAPASFHVSDTEMSAYLLDTWHVSKRLQFNLGIRQDWDQKVSDLAWSPRLAFSWSPFASGRTRISRGYSLTHDAVTMGMLGRPLAQTAVTMRYNPGGTPAGPPALTPFTSGNVALALVFHFRL
jgi:outer membrane receptor protein involved in Fe transport